MCSKFNPFKNQNIKVKLKVDFSSQKVTRQKCFVVTFIGRYHR